MWRYVAGAVAALALIAAGVLVFSGRARSDGALPSPPAARVAGGQDEAPLPDTVPQATQKTREEKRFGRYDKDRNGQITRDEYLASRRKAYAKLDANGDGVLQFDEWAGKSLAKFTAADADRSGAMTPAEFATTAVKRKPSSRPANCPPPRSRAAEDES